MKSQFMAIMKQKSTLDNENEERTYVSSDYTRLVGLVTHRLDTTYIQMQHYLH